VHLNLGAGTFLTVDFWSTAVLYTKRTNTSIEKRPGKQSLPINFDRVDPAPSVH
jgi:hypothetical protein